MFVSEEENTTLFVGNLSVFATAQDLSAAFRHYGVIKQVRLKSGRDGRNNCGYGFVQFTSHSDAMEALQTLNGVVFMGRALRLQWAGSRDSNQASDAATRESPAADGIQVLVSFASRKPGNRITEGTLYSIFSSYGPIQDISIKKNNQHEIELSGLHSGYGFITFINSTAGMSGAVAAAQRVHGVLIDDVMYDCRMSYATEEMLRGQSHVPHSTATASGSAYRPSPPSFYQTLRTNDIHTPQIISPPLAPHHHHATFNSAYHARAPHYFQSYPDTSHSVMYSVPYQAPYSAVTSPSPEALLPYRRETSPSVRSLDVHPPPGIFSLRSTADGSYHGSATNGRGLLRAAPLVVAEGRAVQQERSSNITAGSVNVLSDPITDEVPSEDRTSFNHSAREAPDAEFEG